ncbi:MAG TPA: beta-phosphoglucomutase family hydrolase [Acidimicrobiales bacterium]|nr:beta-phosphoglucomutase family hydrolase [Acidimicrobiales bacterium]
MTSVPSSPSEVDLSGYQAWLFDMDGVLTKTALVHAAAWQQAFDAFLQEETARTGTSYAPFDPESDYEKYVDGEPRADGVRNFLAARGITLPEGTDSDPPTAATVCGVGNRKNDLVLAVMKKQGVQVYEGVTDLIGALKARGVKVAVVSASENTVAALSAAGINQLFDARVDGHTVKDLHLAGKPAPDSFLQAAKDLGVEAAHAVVLEDALAGVEAGRAGHFGLVIGVDHHDEGDAHDYADQLREHGANVVVRELSELVSP